MTQDQAFQIILDVLKSAADLKSKIPLEKLSLQTQIRKEMGFDSLAMVAFFYELQDRHPNLNEESSVRWVTLADCAKALTEA